MKLTRVLRLAMAVALMAAAGYAMRGYITDDTFIHLRYAENLLQYGEFSFNPGQHSYGATSPLWIFGLALLLKLGLTPFAAATTLGGISGLLVVLLVDKILTRLSFPEGWKALFLLAVVSDTWLLRWTWSGMETPLATAFLLLLLWPLYSGLDLRTGPPRDPLWRRYLAWGLAAGLAGLVRPEFMLIAPLALPLLLWFEYFRAGAIGGRAARFRARPYKPLMAAAGGWALVIGPWLAYAWFSFGRILPGTASAKSSGGTGDVLVIVGYLWQAIKMLAATQGVLWVGMLLLIFYVLYRNGKMSEPGLWHHADAGAHREELATGEGPWSVWGPVAMVGIAVVWTVALLGGYALREVWIISRYVSPLSPVLLLAMGLIAEWLMRGTAIDRHSLWIGRRIIVLFVALNVAFNAWIFIDQVVPHSQQFPAGVRECYLDMGHWLRDNTPDDVVIAALDIGAVGYGSERRVLDLMGLVSPEVLEVGVELGFQEMVTSGAWLKLGPDGSHPDYFIDRAEGEPRWAGRTVDGVRFDLLETCLISGVGLRETQPWTVALYRLVSTETRVKSSAGK